MSRSKLRKENDGHPGLRQRWTGRWTLQEWALCVISWLLHDSRDVISTWWRQIWRRCGPYGLYGTVWYDFILRLYCIVGPILWFLLFVIVPEIVACYLIFLRGSIADFWIFDPRNAFSSLFWLFVWLSVIFPLIFVTFRDNLCFFEVLCYSTLNFRWCIVFFAKTSVFEVL